MRMQALYGVIPRIYGKGELAKVSLEFDILLPCISDLHTLVYCHYKYERKLGYVREKLALFSRVKLGAFFSRS